MNPENKNHPGHQNMFGSRCQKQVMVLTGLAFFVTSPAWSTALERNHAITFYAGRLTDGDWGEALLGQAAFVEAHLLAGSVSWVYLRSTQDAWSLEMEGNTSRYFGDQNHWELNAMTSARWLRFPWNHALISSIAFGVGPSYASEIPAVEVSIGGGSEKLLFYWQLELTGRRPSSAWELMFRLHHRSTAYGTFGEQGGSNALAMGVRFWF